MIYKMKGKYLLIILVLIFFVLVVKWNVNYDDYWSKLEPISIKTDLNIKVTKVYSPSGGISFNDSLKASIVQFIPLPKQEKMYWFEWNDLKSPFTMKKVADSDTLILIKSDGELIYFLFSDFKK